MNDPVELMTAAESGSTEAQLLLGQRFLAGDGVVESISIAVYWLRKAAKQGKLEAQEQLGILCAEGWIEAQTDASNYVWLKVAEERAHELASEYLSTFYTDQADHDRSVSEIVRDWRRQATGGDKRLQARLGMLFWYGFGVEEDHVQALQWLRSAADGGPPSAKYKLGEFLLDRGTVAAVTEGISLYAQAANEGYAPAADALGSMYQVRESDDPYTEDQVALGVKPDNANAAHYFRLAASHGNEWSAASLYHMMRDGEVTPADDFEEASWATAASQWNAGALAYLAEMYETGRGVPKDVVKAEQLRSRAGRSHSRPMQVGDAF